MACLKREKTNYPGVFFLLGTSPSGKPERIFYIRYRKDGRLIEEKAGRQFQDDMTAARASYLRAERVRGHALSNMAKREQEETEKREQEDRLTIDRLWEKYQENKTVYKSRKKDIDRYRKHLHPHFGEKEPSEIIPLDVDRLRINLSQKRSLQTVKNVLELLRRIINFGAKRGLTPGLKFKIEMPRPNNLTTEDLTPEEFSRLLRAIDEDSDIQGANIMRMALFTGMRAGEIFKLEWSDLDFEKGFILIRAPKGGHDQRIPLNTPARELLGNHPRTDSPFVFPGRNGRQRQTARHTARRIRERAGLPPEFRPLHGLRHVYASMLASSGRVDMYTLQKLLTHKSPAMTQRYAHLRDEALKKASDVAGDLFGELLQANGKPQVVNLKDRHK